MSVRINRKRLPAESGLYVTAISVKADAAPDVPARVSGLTLTADADGAHRVTGHFKAPAGDINGNSALAFNSSASLNLSFTPTAASPSAMSVTARVTAPGDDAPANDETEALGVELGASQLAPVTDLAIDSSSDTPALTWSDPTAVPNLVFEAFDHYTLWLIDKAGDWAFFDGDGVVTTPRCTIPTSAKNSDLWSSTTIMPSWTRRRKTSSRLYQAPSLCLP